MINIDQHRDSTAAVNRATLVRCIAAEARTEVRHQRGARKDIRGV